MASRRRAASRRTEALPTSPVAAMLDAAAASDAACGPDELAERPMLSLGHGMVRWSLASVVAASVAPAHDTGDDAGAAATSAAGAMGEPLVRVPPLVEGEATRYGPVEGLTELREAAGRRWAVGAADGAAAASGEAASSSSSSVRPPLECVVTAGSNQGFVAALMALCDPGDAVVLVTPYFFNHAMAVALAGLQLRVASCHPRTLRPDLEDVRRCLRGGEGGAAAKVLVICTPSNPSGIVLDRTEVDALAAAADEVGAWLLSDEAYAQFPPTEETADDVPASSGKGASDNLAVALPVGEHVLHLRTFSKFHGGAGFRIGFVLMEPSVAPVLMPAMAKVQDTIPICASIFSQRVALAALQSSAVDDWATTHARALATNRRVLVDRLVAAGFEVSGRGGEQQQVSTEGSSEEGSTPPPPPPLGGVYAVVRVPVAAGSEEDPETDLADECVRFLAASPHRVLVLSCTAAGLPGWVRVCYSFLSDDAFASAVDRLVAGLAAFAKRKSG